MKEVKWARGVDHFFDGPFFFDSNSKRNYSECQYTGDKISNCSLKIHQAKHTDAGRYAFRFLIDNATAKYTGVNGPVLQVTGKF